MRSNEIAGVSTVQEAFLRKVEEEEEEEEEISNDPDLDEEDNSK